MAYDTATMFTTRFAANRAGTREFGGPGYYTIVPVKDGDKLKYRVEPTKAPPKEGPEPNSKAAKAAAAEDRRTNVTVFPPPNKTRAADEARAKAEGKAAKAAKAPGAAHKQSAAAKALGKRAQLEADARAGKLPPVPDFSAETHTRFRKKLDELVALVKAKDIAALKAYPINPISTSPKAMDRYRNLAVLALTAQLKSEAA